jgi:predicted PurR-regulated permease PerM
MAGETIKFDYTISWGNIVTVICMVVGFIFGYSTLLNQADTNKVQIQQIQSVIDNIPRNYINRNEFDKQEQRLSRIEAKLDRLIEIQIKSN